MREGEGGGERVRERSYHHCTVEHENCSKHAHTYIPQGERHYRELVADFSEESFALRVCVCM